MDQTKPWYQSAGVLGSVVSGLAFTAQFAGYTISPDDQATIATGISHVSEIVVSGVGIVSSAVALWGRIRASKKIG